jgi:site-specific DNA-methyltransferase (cytosine-N4-specific)
MEGTQYVFQRWQIQCKNTRRLTLEDVAKEVGLTFQIKSQVVLLVTTGQVGREARGLARSVMETSNLNVVFIDGTDLRSLQTDISRIHTVLHGQAQHVMALKAQQIADFITDAESGPGTSDE